MPFKSFGLSDPLVRGILATGYTAPTEIQSQAIPAALAGKDIIGCAQTGTGKTAAFVLPILHRLSHEKSHDPKVVKSLILTPTRELAMQVEDSVKQYGRFLKIKALAIFGGVDIQKQIQNLRRGADIIVATPGRLIDLLQRQTLRLDKIEVLVLDEADRMLDMGFIHDMRRIIALVPEKRQTLLFSATISNEVKTLAADMQSDPVIIQIGPERNPIDTITQHIYPVEKENKLPFLLHLLKSTNMFSVLVFVRTKHKADKISYRLKREDINAVAIHSDRTQQQRRQALDGFKAGKFQVMVATDIAARGLDIEGITHVINFDVPAYAEDYIHRIGRTGRAKAVGDAITLVSSDEERQLRDIEKFIGKPFKTKPCEGFTYDRPDSPPIRTAAAKPHAEKPKPQQHPQPAARPARPQRPQRAQQPQRPPRPQHAQKPQADSTREQQSHTPSRKKRPAGRRRRRY